MSAMSNALNRRAHSSRSDLQPGPAGRKAGLAMYTHCTCFKNYRSPPARPTLRPGTSEKTPIPVGTNRRTRPLFQPRRSIPGDAGSGVRRSPLAAGSQDPAKREPGREKPAKAATSG